MAAIGDRDVAALHHFGAAVALVNSDFGESGEHIGGGDPLGHLANLVGVLTDEFAKLLEDFVFQFVNLFLGVEDAGFPLFEFGGDVAFFVGEGLLADVVVGGLVGFAARDADVVAKRFVEADFQGGDASAFPFGGFQLGDPVLVAFDLIAQGVEVGVDAGADQVAFGEVQGGAIRPGAIAAYLPASPVLAGCAEGPSGRATRRLRRGRRGWATGQRNPPEPPDRARWQYRNPRVRRGVPGRRFA